jgi:hypothetical protein
MNEAVSCTSDLLDGQTKQQFRETSARYLETLANRIDLQPANNRGPPCGRTPPSRAMAKSDPARETVLLTPDAVPARSDSTEVRTRVVKGAIA